MYRFEQTVDTNLRSLAIHSTPVHTSMRVSRTIRVDSRGFSPRETVRDYSTISVFDKRDTGPVKKKLREILSHLLRGHISILLFFFYTTSANVLG